MSDKWIVEFKLKVPVEVINCKGKPIVVFVDATCDWNKDNKEYIKVTYQSDISK